MSDEVDAIIEEATSTIGTLEEQQDTLIAAINSALEHETDSTLSQAGWPADAAACGDVKSALNEDYGVYVFPRISNILSIPNFWNRGYLVRSDSSIWKLSGYSTSCYIPVEPSTVYKFIKLTSAAVSVWISFYSSSKTFISGYDGQSLPKTFTSPSNAAYMTLGCANGHIKYLAVQTYYYPFTETYTIDYKEIRNTSILNNAVKYLERVALSGHENIALLSTWLDGYYRSSAGQDLVAASYRRSDFIPVSPSTTYYANEATFVCYYKSDLTFISGESTPPLQFTTPANCSYIVISHLTSNKQYCLTDADVFEEFGKTIYVGQNQQYTKLIDAVEYSNNHRDTTIIVKPGVYDIVSEYGGQSSMPGTGGSGSSSLGMQIGNNVTIIFEEGASVECIYTGGDANVEQGFSIFNAIHPTGNSDYTIIGFSCYAKNIRYCVHDEMASSEMAYTHKYINCSMYLDNTESSWTAHQCIGGGLGTSGRIQVEDCTFDSPENYPLVSWHNHYMANSKSDIIIKDCYFVQGGVEFYNYGQQTEKTIVKVCGNSMKLVPAINGYEGYPEMITLWAWNNEIRT